MIAMLIIIVYLWLKIFKVFFVFMWHYLHYKVFWQVYYEHIQKQLNFIIIETLYFISFIVFNEELNWIKQITDAHPTWCSSNLISCFCFLMKIQFIRTTSIRLLFNWVYNLLLQSWIFFTFITIMNIFTFNCEFMPFF